MVALTKAVGAAPADSICQITGVLRNASQKTGDGFGGSIGG